MQKIAKILLPPLASLLIAGPALAGQVSTIDCSLRAMSPQERTSIGVSLANDEHGGEALTAAREAITPMAIVCGKANKWSFDQELIAVSWTMWSILSDELQHESGMSAADAKILRTYFYEHTKQLENMMEFTAAQRIELIGNLRKLGAHLHDDGSKLSEQELTIILLAQQMRGEEAKFAASS